MCKKEANSLPYVSVIIPNFNGGNYLKMCLSSLKTTSYPLDKLEVIVVDNNSTDGSYKIVEEFHPLARCLRLDKNYGFTGACNRGAKQSKGELLVFLNNDTIVTENWLIKLVKVAMSDESIGICGSKIVFAEDPTLIDYAGGYLNIVGDGVSVNIWRKNKSVVISSPVDTGYVVGTCLLIKKKLFEKLGGFDEDYFMYCDEGDLCWRSWLLGYRTVYVPNSIIYHFKEASIFKKGGGRKYYIHQRRKLLYLGGRISSEIRVYYGNRNALFNIIKNLELKNLILGILSSLLYSFIQVILLIQEKKVKLIPLLFKAWLAFFRGFSSIWMKRKDIQKMRIKSDKELFEAGILLDVRQLMKMVLISIKSYIK
jgi:GT2 family glycosyltransferase